MIRIRKAGERGHADHGWLEARHSFSFAEYHDAAHMGFGDLVVLNEDRIAPGRGFPMHGHREMEILTYVLAGALAHKDSAGHEGVIGPDEFQFMSAGAGVRHSEFNASPTEQTHLLQIWIQPSRGGGAPRYAQRKIEVAEKSGRLALVAAPEGAFDIGQDARILVGRPATATPLVHAIAPGRRAWVQVTRGGVVLNGEALSTGDGAAVTGEARLAIAGEPSAEVLLFDLR